ncbi:hypothetical protein A3Q56_06743 [Intoshia linei]|uniref:Uncharacterized protein n=1 Tax=Intoshia linei TaxID=1819745 RepID=A0A177AUN1_9BILA|nr:hypothetical protein A3Q56_06743 [Intoshia linei]
MVPLNLQSNRNVKKNLIDKPKKMNSIENFNRESNLPIINSFSKPHSLQNQEKSKLSSTNLKVIDDVNGTNEYKMEMKPLQINNQNERLNFYKSFENQQPNLDSKPFYANGYNSKASSTDSDIGNRVKINSHGNNHLNREYNSIDSISKSINEPTYTDSNSNLRFKKLSNEELTEKLNDRVNETTQSGVVGTNEIYNDPRERIIAQRKFKIDDKIKSTTLDYPYERMSFGDKVKLFNNSNATKNILAYPKSSRAQRVIEKNYD